jgi:hypothetical protein
VSEEDVPADILGRLRAICAALPESYEEDAWVGRRWRIRQRTFAHALTIVDGTPQAHARAAGTDGPATVLTFRSTGPELLALRESGRPFFYGGWGRDVIGMHLDAGTDWVEVGELLTESYRFLAPQRLAARMQE